MATDLLTTAQAAERMGCSQQWIQSLIGRGKLKAQRFGKFYMVSTADADNYEHQPPGRPVAKKPVKRGNGKKPKKRA